MLVGDQAQLRGLAGAAGWAGLCSGLQQSPSSSSRHRGGSAEPAGVWELRWALLPGLSCTRTAFPGLDILTLPHPLHCLKNTLNSLCPTNQPQFPHQLPLLLPSHPRVEGCWRWLWRSWALLGAPHSHCCPCILTLSLWECAQPQGGFPG